MKTVNLGPINHQTAKVLWADYWVIIRRITPHEIERKGISGATAGAGDTNPRPSH